MARSHQHNSNTWPEPDTTYCLVADKNWPTSGNTGISGIPGVPGIPVITIVWFLTQMTMWQQAMFPEEGGM